MRTELQCVQSITVSFYHLITHPEFSLCIIWILLIILYFICWIYQRHPTKSSAAALPQSQDRGLLSSTSREAHFRRVFAPAGVFPVQVTECYERESTPSWDWHDGWSAGEVSIGIHLSGVCAFAEECGGSVLEDEDVERRSMSVIGGIEEGRLDGIENGSREEEAEEDEEEEGGEEEEEEEEEMEALVNVEDRMEVDSDEVERDSGGVSKMCNEEMMLEAEVDTECESDAIAFKKRARGRRWRQWLKQFRMRVKSRFRMSCHQVR
ncbi:unnamed protein product [Taenia asiatica]|uniref:Transmembrane protein n=1 Tax=Taenia asiatica TaxID=60517 RepID=A0A0R3WDD0_TAEAS|nr:unnamed protein product [Taenia asiatica]